MRSLLYAPIREYATLKLLPDKKRTSIIGRIEKVIYSKYYKYNKFNKYKENKKDYYGIIKNKPSINFNKPIYLGMCILDYSKLHMYEFYYNVINKLWPNNYLVGSDTDSFFLSIESPDIYKDKEKIIDELDTSDYPKDHPLYSIKNKKVMGKFKDELNGKIMNEIILFN